MKALKIIGIVILVLVALFFLIGILLPSEVSVEREKMFDADPQVVFNQVNTIKNWEDWSAWHQMADDMEITYSGPTSGEGAGYSWTSETIGNGSQKIIESRPYEYIKTKLDFQQQGTANGNWRFSQVNDSTKVVWTLNAEMGDGIFDKYMGLAMDVMVGSSFETSLNNITEQIKEFLGTNNLRGKPAEYFAGSILTFRSKPEILLFRFRNKFGMTTFFGPRRRASGNSID